MERKAKKDEILKQSQRAYDRWKDIWHENARRNAACYEELPRLEGRERGKSLLLFAFGPSFKENIRDIKENGMHHEADIMCVDKALPSLLENGIVPKYVMVCDAQVNFEKYGKIDPELCKSIDLLCTITCNAKWAEYWKNNGGKSYYTVNKDNIRTHKIYGKYLDPTKAYFIPAASNVANSAYVIATMILGYKEIFLAAFDYSFKIKGNYYGDDSKPKDTNYNFDKHSENNHYTMLDVNGELVQASSNMYFSARWLTDFINQVMKQGINYTVNITGHGILHIPMQSKLLRKEAA